MLSLLDPDVVLQTDGGGRGPLSRAPVTGARQVAKALSTRGRSFAPMGRPAVVNGGPGVIVGPPGRVLAVVGITFSGALIREIDIIGDPAKLGRIKPPTGKGSPR